MKNGQELRNLLHVVIISNICGLKFSFSHIIIQSWAWLFSFLTFYGIEKNIFLMLSIKESEWNMYQQSVFPKWYSKKNLYSPASLTLCYTHQCNNMVLLYLGCPVQIFKQQYILHKVQIRSTVNFVNNFNDIVKELHLQCVQKFP